MSKQKMIYVKPSNPTSDYTRTCPHIASFEQEEDRIIGPNVMVCKREEIEITFDYPLGHEVTLKFRNQGGFNRRDFLRAVAQGYRQIYREEDEAVGDPGQVSDTCINRGFSKGPHGIWGHYMGDLFFEGYAQPKPGKFTLSIGS